MYRTTADGLPNNRVIELKEDKNGNVWIGTLNGLARYKPNHTLPLILIESTLADKVYTNSSETISVPSGRNLKISLEMSSEVMIDAIISDVLDFRGNKDSGDDDMTIVIAKVL